MFCLLAGGATAAPLASTSALSADEKCTSYQALADDIQYVGSKTGQEWCEKNCAVGFCPEDRCKCVTAGGSAPDDKNAAQESETSEDKCITYQALADDAAYVGAKSGQAWCEHSCAMNFCPEDRCKCVTAADAKRTKEEAKESDEDKLKRLHTQLPRKVAPKISGPWFYVADGTGHEPLGAQRNELYGREVNKDSVTGRKVPDWLASSASSGNAISLAFMDPRELDQPGHGVPNAFIEYTSLLRNGTENRDRQIYFAIGGIAFSGFHFLSNDDTAQKAGKDACEVARKYNVGIEIDHETSSGNDVEGLKSFTKGFRKQCPMGKYPLSIDLMGSPSGGGLNWMAKMVEELIPEGGPGDPPPGDGNYMDFVNLMVIDGCQAADCLTQFWQMWEDHATLNFKRAALTFQAGGGFGVCDNKNSDILKEAWKFGKSKEAYGLRAWSVTPAGGGEWDPECDEIGAPGFKSMCEAVGACH